MRIRTCRSIRKMIVLNAKKIVQSLVSWHSGDIMSHILNPIIRLFPNNARSWEILLWFILAGLFSGRFWIFILQEGYFNPKYLPDFYTSILTGIVTLLIPLLFWLVNGQLPLGNNSPPP